MTSKGFKCSSYYQDLLQEGYLYLISKGNPIDENGNLVISSNTYERSHGAFLYKKAYFNAISNIRSFYRGRNVGEIYETDTQSATVRDSEDEDINLFINSLSQDDSERQILKYFSENMFCDRTIKEACKRFKVNKDYIQNLLAKLRAQYLGQEVSLD